jgi:hypothetical protein
MVTRLLHWGGRALGSVATFALYVGPFVLAFIASTVWQGLRDGWSRQWLSSTN